MFSLSTFSSKSKESSSFLKSSNRTSCHQNQQPVSFSGIPSTFTSDSTGLRNSNTRPLVNHVGIGNNEAKEDKKYPLLNSAGVSRTLMTPHNFRVTRRVGSDSLLVAWTTPDDDEITGYLVRNTCSIHQLMRPEDKTLHFRYFLDTHLLDFNYIFRYTLTEICTRKYEAHPAQKPSCMI